MEMTLERCPSDFDAPGAKEMETDELLPFESVTLPPIKIEEEDTENAVDESEEEEDFGSPHYLSAPISPVTDESEVPNVSEKQGELEPSSFLSVSMATVKHEPEEGQEEDEDEEEEIEPSHFLTVSMASLKEESDQQTKEDEEEEEELEPLASVTLSPPIEDVSSKNVQHPSGKWSVHVEGQLETGGGKRVVSSGVWVPGVEDCWSSSNSPNPQPPKPSPEDRRSSATPKPFSCEVCAKSFTQKYTLKMHRRMHSETMPYRCRACPASFESPSALSQHVAAHKAQRRYPCDVCGASFIQRGELNIHLRSHSEERPHCCTLCDKSYKQKSNSELDKKDYLPVIAHGTPNVADLVQPSSIKTVLEDGERRFYTATGATAVNKNRPPTGQKRKVERTPHVSKHIDETNPILKQTATEPKVAKDESYLFCELLKLKLRALDDVSCEMAMHEINNIMFHFKNSFSHCCQQPGHIKSDVQLCPDVNQHPSPVCSSHERASSLLRGLLQVNDKMK